MFKTQAEKDKAKRLGWTVGAVTAGWLLGGPILGIPAGIVAHMVTKPKIAPPLTVVK